MMIMFLSHEVKQKESMIVLKIKKKKNRRRSQKALVVNPQFKRLPCYFEFIVIKSSLGRK